MDTLYLKYGSLFNVMFEIFETQPDYDRLLCIRHNQAEGCYPSMQA